MHLHTRRRFLETIGLGAGALQAAQMPGRPTAAGSETQPAHSNIMAIAAHPGDAFFAMGAPVALEASLGGHAVLLSLSLGERGSASIPTARYGAMQRESAERAARMLGAQAAFLTWPDGEISVHDEVKFAVCDMIRQYKPAIVVTHWRGSWHKDHRSCYDLVNDAVFYAGLPAIARKDPAHSAAKTFYADNWEDADGFRADTFLDITPVFDRWIEACAAFPMWLGENGFRYSDYYRGLAMERGALSGSRYAVALMSPAEQLVRRVRSL
jgi:LmbE family N-acetylglucosaminyl deacetylase